MYRLPDDDPAGVETCWSFNCLRKNCVNINNYDSVGELL